MKHLRIAAVALIALAILPAVLISLNMSGPMPPLDDPSVVKILTWPWYWIYIIPVWGLSILVVLRAGLFSKNGRVLWIILVILFSPLTTWALLYRYFWHKPSQVPKDLEDQRRILRDNVAKIKAGEKLP